MKKRIIFFVLIVCTLLVFTSCKTGIGAENTIQETKDNFADYNIEYYNGVSTTEDGKTVEVEMNYLNFGTADEMYNASDYVIIASPEEIFDESKQIWYNREKVETDDFSKVDISYSYTERKLKVQKVYKGDDLKLKELTFCEHFVASDTEMKALFLNDYPLVKGEKYLFFLKKANTEEEKYFAIPTQGVYSLDSDKNTSNLEKQVKEMFKDEFKDK